MKPLFVRQARRPDQASSAATMINVARANNSNMVHPQWASSRIKLKSISRGHPQARKLATPTKDLKLEKMRSGYDAGLFALQP